MRPILLAFVAVVAFAANSLAARAALADIANDPFAFALLRLCSGAVALAFFLKARPTWRDLPGSLALSVYMFGFAAAYTAISTATGALILFSVVQLSVLIISAARGERMSALAITGSTLALIGLFVLLYGNLSAAALAPVLFMVAAGMAWGVYTILGRGSQAPLQQTGRQFALASLLSLPMVLAVGQGNESAALTAQGAGLAVASGVVFSGLGYALWYAVSPRLPAATIASVQLLTPVVAAAMGAVFLTEPITLQFVLAALIILGGVALTLPRSKS